MVDSRLFRIGGRRVVRLRKEDLPELARAIVAVTRIRARAGVTTVANVSYVEIVGKNVDVMIPAEDWKKILPYVQDESFNPTLFPARQASQPLDPQIAFDELLLDHADKPLYERTLGILTGLFNETFPTRPF